MDRKIMYKLLFIVTLCLFVASVVTLGISIFGDSSDTTPLSAAMCCIVSANLCVVVQRRLKKKKL